MGKIPILPALVVAAMAIALVLNSYGSICPGGCDDGNPCTADICGPETGYKCMYTALSGEAGACSGETEGCMLKACEAGACVEKKVRACEYGVSCALPAQMSPPYEYYKLAKGRPSFTCTVANLDNISGVLELSAELEGYSPAFRERIELGPNETREVGIEFLFRDEFFQVGESKFALLKVEAESGGRLIHSEYKKVQLEKSSIYSPPKGEEELIALWVTYNDPCIEEFISEAKKFTTDGEFRAYNAKEERMMEELEAVFYALRHQGITYVSSTLSTTDNKGTSYNQDIRLPWSSLAYKQMNCADGAVLYAAILEKLEYETAVAFSPGHAFVLVRSGGKNWGSSFFGGIFSGWDEDWIAIETTDTGDPSVTFEEAVKNGQRELNKGGVKIVDVHKALESGVVPMPAGEHQCGIRDLTLEAEEHQALLGNEQD